MSQRGPHIVQAREKHIAATTAPTRILRRREAAMVCLLGNKRREQAGAVRLACSASERAPVLEEDSLHQGMHEQVPRKSMSKAIFSGVSSPSRDTPTSTTPTLNNARTSVCPKIIGSPSPL